MRYTYPEGGERKSVTVQNSEWEEVEFRTELEEKPVIQIGNVAADCILIGEPIKLIINNPDLFGTYKTGDIIDFTPLPRTTTVIPRTENHDGSGVPGYEPKAN
ncbi:Uncharacterised protein [uncultured archaeon]|nr:Uncharacterised protein [uncultured archaeon]